MAAEPDLDVDATPRAKPPARFLVSSHIQDYAQVLIEGQSKKASGLPKTEEEGLPEGSDSPRSAFPPRVVSNLAF